MKRFLLLTVSASALLSSTASFAQEVPALPAAPRAGPRASVGVGALVGLRIEGPNESADGGLGLYLRGGVQVNDLLGVEDDVSFAAAPVPGLGVLVLVRDSIDLTVTPVDWLTFAAGPVASWGASESAWALGG